MDSSMRKNILTILAAAAVLVVLGDILIATGTLSSSALSLPFQTKPAQHAEIHSVAVFGDSLVFGASGDLQTQLAKYSNSDIHGVIGTSTSQIEPLIAEVHQAKHPDAVVLALGTNDLIPVFLASNETERALHMIDIGNHQETVLQSLSDTPCVIWVGVQEHNTERNLVVLGPQLNALLRANVAKYPNAHFVDWEAVMAGHSDWQASDGLHFSPAGNVAYATAMSGAVASQC